MNGSAGADPAPGAVQLREDAALQAGAGAARAARGRCAVQLREDAPLQAGAGAARAARERCAGGPRLLLASFAALSAAITLALFTQIYYGDFEVVPHGGVASDAAACSGAGTAALKDGGRALDAAAAAALCLAVLAPHRTSLDASGSLLYWEYRQARSRPPTLAEWGVGSAPRGPPGGPPRLLAALAALHARHGALPWARVLQPAIDLAERGFAASDSLAAAGALPPGARRTAPALAAYLQSLQRNTSAELSSAWNSDSMLAISAAEPSPAGAWRLVLGGPGAEPARRALARALSPPPAGPADASARIIAALQQEAAASEGGAWPPAPGAPASGLAVVDSFDTYVALVTGLSAPFGSGPAAPGGWTRDVPAPRLDPAPAFLLQARVCGARYVLGGTSGAALAQAAAALAAGAAPAAAVEAPRAALLPGGALAPDARAPVNVVRQRADALLTHADSRGGGLASRF